MPEALTGIADLLGRGTYAFGMGLALASVFVAFVTPTHNRRAWVAEGAWGFASGMLLVALGLWIRTW